MYLGAVTLITDTQVTTLPDTQVMTQDLEHFMQQTQESMLMTATETNVIADKADEGPVDQQPEPNVEPGLDEI